MSAPVKGKAPRYPAERIGLFDIFKIGVGPSSSHTMGPWRAALDFLAMPGLRLRAVERVQVDLYGSLAKTGRGHGTDLAVFMGLGGYDPKSVDISFVVQTSDAFRNMNSLLLAGSKQVSFSYDRDVLFHREVVPEYHPNGLDFTADLDDGTCLTQRYYSIGGGFIVRGDRAPFVDPKIDLPYPIDTAVELLKYTEENGMTISEVVERNELVWRSREELYRGIEETADAMISCVTRGLSAEGELPGGLGVRRRAPQLAVSLFGAGSIPDSKELVGEVRRLSDGLVSDRAFEFITRWISCFALAVNEENAAFGRVVTAPTNGAAGVIPAVLLYYLCFDPNAPEPGSPAMYSAATRFLLNAGQIGSVFKTGATISAAMGGCQAEIGVSSAMAASALTELKGGSAAACLQAAEIAMEHHLGLTCDPVGGMVQIPCIERNTMGALKAVTACNLALTSDPATARVSLDNVVQTMWDTACDMSDKYKETSEAGLAVHIPINVIEC